MGRGWRYVPPLVRFEDSYIPEPMSGCWLWLKGLNPNGYGNFRMVGTVTRLAHRISWMLYRGPIPDGMFVLHRCNNPVCVNPDHLYIGTPQDNSNDQIKARSHDHKVYPVGEDHHNAKLTWAEVDEIKRLLAEGKTTKAQIARDFGVGYMTVKNIEIGFSWSRREYTPVPVEDDGFSRRRRLAQGKPPVTEADKLLLETNSVQPLRAKSGSYI